MHNSLFIFLLYCLQQHPRKKIMDRNLVNVFVIEKPYYVEVRLEGQVSISCIGDFTSIIWPILEEKVPINAVLFNMSLVDSIDSTGLAVLVSTHKKSAPVFIYGLSGSVLNTFERVGLNRVFGIFATKDEVLDSLLWKARF